jgi:hypothetical protein
MYILLLIKPNGLLKIGREVQSNLSKKAGAAKARQRERTAIAEIA